jgi:hypothetical protein
MFPFGVTIPATVLQWSENLDRLMNYPVLREIIYLYHHNVKIVAKYFTCLIANSV